MNNLQDFQKWAKLPTSPITTGIKRAVVYTRVSSKEQADKNLSLDFQKRIILEYASKNTFEVLSFFGGTYESAKTDGRKEFQRMLEFIKKNKGTVSHILVYTLDRFSRTGGGAIKLAQELREKYGVTVFAVTQPTDTTNVSGVFQQNIQFLFSEFDNQLRKQRAVAGMKEKFEKGVWCLKPPMGYDVVKVNGERKIIVNETGEQLRKAFKWKAQGMRNDDIIAKLRKAGVTIYRQKLSMIFSNPFYCGIIANRMLGGRLINGTHPTIVSEDIFLEVNNIRQKANKFGTTHRKDFDLLPLKVFMKCEYCGNGFTGYIVKKKNLFYYKCRTTGCKCNQNAKVVNAHFEDFLNKLSIKPELVAPLMKCMAVQFDQLHADSKQQISHVQMQISDLEKKCRKLDEKFHILEEISADTYKSLAAKYQEEKSELMQNLPDTSESSSNLQNYLEKVLVLSSKLATVWASSPTKTKEVLQNAIYPEGVTYNRKNGGFRTTKVNEVFGWIAQQAEVSGDKDKGLIDNKANQSSQVGKTGFEPATPWSQTRCA